MSLKGILGGIDVDVILNSIVQIRARLGFCLQYFEYYCCVFKNAILVAPVAQRYLVTL